jgi:hypothetical protein
MAQVGRIAGALLAVSEGRYFLVGNPKEPCDWERAGFCQPAHIDAVQRPVLALETCGAGPAPLAGLHLVLTYEGETVPRVLAERLLIYRNGSVSERLWGLVVGADPDTGAVAAEPFDADWLIAMPAQVWDVVRESVLRCL